jgi:hypothetical protein
MAISQTASRKANPTAGESQFQLDSPTHAKIPRPIAIAATQMTRTLA